MTAESPVVGPLPPWLLVTLDTLCGVTTERNPGVGR
jgi:hypothetical protein